MEIIKREKTIPVFTVGDRDFTTKAEAEAEVDRLMEVTRYAYYLVQTGYDKTEGRGYFATQIVGIRLDKHHHEPGAIIRYCTDTFGAAIFEWYSWPISTWRVMEQRSFDDPEEADEWIRRNLETRHSNVTASGPILCDGFGVPVEP